MILAVLGVWLHGYSLGKRQNSVVKMSARDLRRALKNMRK